MKEILDNKVLLIILFILIIVGVCLLYFEFEDNDVIGSLYINEDSVFKNENNSDDFHDASTLDDNINKESDIENSVFNTVNKIDINSCDEYNNNVSYTENDVINYFEIMNDEISESDSFKDNFKEYFVTIVDFIFYDKDIKGYTFKEISNIAKIKVISFALKIEARIEQYVPNYKENIASVSGNVYNNIKERLVYLYMDISTNICNNNEDECNIAKNIWSEVKGVCGIGWDFIKNITLNGVEKLKSWYEIYSGRR